MKKILILILGFLLMASGVLASNYGQSIEGEGATLTFDHTAKCDSARVYFGYPATNLYYDVKITPEISADSSLLRGAISLDSVGTHYVEIRYYEQGAGSVSGYIVGQWLQFALTDLETKVQNIEDTTNATLDSLQNLPTLGQMGEAVWTYETRGLTDEEGFSLSATGIDAIWDEDTTGHSSGFGGMLKDTSAYQGAAAGLTAPEVADTLGGRGWMPGIGTNICSLWVYTIDDSQAVSGVPVSVLNNEMSSTIAQNTTNNNGMAFVKLSDGTYKVITELAGYPQVNDYDTFTVSGVSQDTIWVDEYDPGTPTSPLMCRFYQCVYDFTNKPIVGAKATVYLNSGTQKVYNADSTVVVSPAMKIQYATTDDEGYWWLDVYRSSEMRPQNLYYTIVVKLPDGTSRTWALQAPDASQHLVK